MDACQAAGCCSTAALGSINGDVGCTRCEDCCRHCTAAICADPTTVVVLTHRSGLSSWQAPAHAAVVRVEQWVL
jgi:hypothetical protein